MSKSRSLVSGLLPHPSTIPKPSPKVYFSQYRPFPFRLNKVHLSFDIRSPSIPNVEVLLTSRLEFESANRGSFVRELTLNAEDLEIVSVNLDDKVLTENVSGASGSYQYNKDTHTLKVFYPPLNKPFILETVTKLDPANNFTCSGLYMSGNVLMTQCEAEGFRRMTPFPDRPDVLSIYDVEIICDESLYPVLLSNGNLLTRDTVNELGRVRVLYNDPFPKPSYLFALVCGDLVAREGSFKTKSGQDVKINIWTKAKDFKKSEFALQAVYRSMKYDEDSFDREYDLSVYHIVAVDDFNFGAMENKGLNVFSASYVLASSETSTDARFADVEATIAHEYFHNWSGNRVTVRDWFGISLKEGLTTFREQEFCKHHHGKGVCEINNARYMQSAQFAEDAGQMAHPVRPEAYESIDNFYTSTVYQKGACIIGMLDKVLGEDRFRKGLNLFFKRHDGQAVTSEELINCLGEANNVDLSSFIWWLSQSGTPTVSVKHQYNHETQTLTVEVEQDIPLTAADKAENADHESANRIESEDDSFKTSSGKQAMPIPLEFAIFDSQGEVVSGYEMLCDDELIDMDLTSGDAMMLLNRPKHVYKFTGVSDFRALSVLRKFSAPVKIKYPQQELPDLLFLLKHEVDAFSRYSAAKTAIESVVSEALARQTEKPAKIHLSEELVAGLRAVLNDEKCPNDMKAEILSCCPSFTEVCNSLEPGTVDPLRVQAVIDDVNKAIARALEFDMKTICSALIESEPEVYKFEIEQVANRSLKNTLLNYIVEGLQDFEFGLTAFNRARNFTDTLGALYALNGSASDARSTAIETLKEKFSDDALVMRSLCRAICSSDIENNLENVRKLLEDPVLFNDKNPESIRAACCGFVSSAKNYHKEDGSGYEFLAEMIEKVDAYNPIAASQLADAAFSDWLIYSENFRNRIKPYLEKFHAQNHLHKQTMEVIKRALGDLAD